MNPSWNAVQNDKGFSSSWRLMNSKKTSFRDENPTWTGFIFQNYAVDTIFKWIHYPEWNFDPIFTVFWRCFEWNSTNNSWIGSWVQWIILYQKGNLFLRGSFYHLYQFKHDCIFLDCLDLYIQICSYCTRVRIARVISNGKCSCTRTEICSSWNIMICGKSLKSINLN